MIEYLVKRTDGEWFDVEMRDVCRPITVPYEAIDGWGDARIRVGSCEVAFAYEDPGIHISFEGEIAPEVAETVANEVLERITGSTDQAGAVIQISW